MVDLNGQEFWKSWAKAGGNVDEYMKDSLPNYGIIGALLITVSISATISPPSFVLLGDDNVASASDTTVQLYTIFMNVSTACSMSLIILSAAIYQQFVNAYSKELRIDFAAKFGYMVNILTILLVSDICGLFGGLFIAVATLNDPISAWISIAIVLTSLALSMWYYYYMTTWNASHYVQTMARDLQKLEDESAKKQKGNDTSSSLVHPISQGGDDQDPSSLNEAMKKASQALLELSKALASAQK